MKKKNVEIYFLLCMLMIYLWKECKITKFGLYFVLINVQIYLNFMVINLIKNIQNMKIKTYM